MSCEKFDPNCPECRPALVDRRDGKKLPLDHPFMFIVNYVWDSLPFESQEAFWRVCVNGSTDPDDLMMVEDFSKKLDRMSISEGN